MALIALTSCAEETCEHRGDCEVGAIHAADAGSAGGAGGTGRGASPGSTGGSSADSGDAGSGNGGGSGGTGGVDGHGGTGGTTDPCTPSPENPDSDNDGVSDRCDTCADHDDRLDADGDLTPDGCDACALGDDRVTGDDNVPDACQFVSVGGGLYRACALTREGSVMCWGECGLEECEGDGQSAREIWRARSPAGQRFKKIAVGAQHSCAIDTANKAFCWGRGHDGRLGTGTYSDSAYEPLEVKGLGEVLDIAAGEHHSCAVLANGNVSCWGRNHLGQGARTESSTEPLAQPIAPFGVHFIGIDAGGHTTCAVSTIGELYCWGSGYGPAPVLVEMPNATRKVRVGAGGVRCATTTANKMYCWGSGTRGELGDGKQSDSSTPVSPALPDGTPVADFATSLSSTCAIADRMYCWGFGEFGRLGANSGQENSAIPVPTAKPPIHPIATGAGWHFQCAIDPVGQMYCWGSNYGDVLGVPETVTQWSDVPLLLELP